MSDLIKLTPSVLETRNASGALTFSTDENYVCSDPGGIFKIGGINRAPCIAGQDNSDPYTFPDIAENVGFSGVLTRTAVSTAYGTGWSSEFYIPADIGSNLQWIESMRFPAPGHPIYYFTMDTPTNPNVTLYEKTSYSGAYTAVLSLYAVRYAWQLWPMGYPNGSAVDGSDGIAFLPETIAYTDYCAANPGKIFKLQMESNWADAGYSQIPGTARIHQFLPSIGIAPRTLALAVTP